MSKFGSYGSADAPFRVEIIDPATDSPIKDKDGKTFYVDVYSTDSARGRKLEKDERTAMLEASRKGRQIIEDPLDRNIAKCAALTAGWHLVDTDTSEAIDVSCTPENAKEFYSLPITNWIFIQVWVAANNNANFIKRSAKNSSNTQSGNSAIAAD